MQGARGAHSFILINLDDLRHFRVSRLGTMPPILPFTHHGIALGTVGIDKILTEKFTCTCVSETIHSSLVIWQTFS